MSTLCNMRVSRESYTFPFSHYPAVRLVLLFAAGIVMAGFTAPSPVVLFSLSGFLLVVCGLLHHRIRKSPNVSLGTALTVLYLLLIMSLGFTARGLQKYDEQFPKAEERLAQLHAADTLNWFGRVDDARLSPDRSLSVFMRVDSVQVTTGETVLNKTFNTQIRYFRADSLFTSQIESGSLMKLRAVPSAIPAKRNPHDFDVRSWLNGLGIYVQATGVMDGQSQILRQPNWRDWGWWRSGMRNGIARVFDEDQTPLAQAVLIGYRSGLDSDLRQDFSRAGLAHLMAVSGMHVGFVLIPLWFIIPFFWRYKYGSIAGLLLVTVVLFLYAGITGFSPSVQRASVFAFFIALARLYRYRRDPINLTGLAALLILIVNPSSLYLIGFQMSFGAVLTIFVMLPVLERLFTPRNRTLWYARIVQLTLLSVCIQLALMPILIHRFNEFSLIGPLMNTLAAPVTQVMFIWGFAGVFLGMIHEQAGVWFNLPANYLTALLAWLTTTSANLPGAFITARLHSLWIYPLWIALFAAAATMFKPALRFRMLIVCGLLAVGWQGDLLWQKHREAPALQLTFFDVGQGDAVLIETAHGKRYLYDAGLWSPFGNSGDRFILPHLRAEGITRLDGVFLSHPHADHIGGLIPIIREIEIGVIYDPGFEYHSAIFAGYRAAAREQGIRIEVPEMGDTIWLDESTPALVLGPHPDISSSNPNEHSLVVQIVYGNQRVLLTGDAETQAERLLAEQFGELLRSDVYKAGHHGSRTSSHEFFLEYVQPEKAVVSNGLRNRYNHPHPIAAWRMLQHTGEERLLYTALEGAVILRLDGENIHRVEWR